VRIVIADDELLARQRLERLAGALPDVELVAICATAADALDALRHEAADVALLDIDMPGLSGLEVAALVGNGGPKVIFVTAHPEHALAAFGVGALDYLLKPVDAARLAAALSRVTATPRRETADPLPFSGPQGVRLVLPAEITHAVIDGETVCVHAGGRALFTELTLNELERRLPADRFVRVHRRALVAIDAIELLEPNDEGGYVARLRDGDRVGVSRAAARGLRRRLAI
jgi:two-component system LytT family response regulator